MVKGVCEWEIFCCETIEEISMKSNHNQESELMERAVCSDNLINRAEGNQRFGNADFGAWTKELLSGISFSSVLDVCCGTGNQLVLYDLNPNIERIVGVDVSEQALLTARARLSRIDRVMLKVSKMEDMFCDTDIKGNLFDLVSCFYGLYYAQKVESTLQKMIDQLSDNGTLLIVGPHGENNAALFYILQRYFELPPAVIRSVKTFMEQEVLPIISKRCSVKIEYFVNEICYPDSKAVLDYWRASTFYSPEHEVLVKKDIENCFLTRGEFVVKKHVVAYIARKGK